MSEPPEASCPEFISIKELLAVFAKELCTANFSVGLFVPIPTLPVSPSIISLVVGDAAVLSNMK